MTTAIPAIPVFHRRPLRLASLVSRAKGERAVTYAYVQLRQQALGGRKLYAKTLTVSFDANDVATDVDLQTSGEK